MPYRDLARLGKCFRWKGAWNPCLTTLVQPYSILRRQKLSFTASFAIYRRHAIRARPVRRQIRTDKIRDCVIIIRKGRGAEKLELSSKNLDSTPPPKQKKLVLAPICYVKNNVAPHPPPPPTSHDTDSKLDWAAITASIMTNVIM